MWNVIKLIDIMHAIDARIERHSTNYLAWDL